MCVCVCVCVCPVEISFYVRLHQPGIVPTVYELQMLTFYVWISLKTYESKVMRVNTFHGDPTLSLWR